MRVDVEIGHFEITQGLQLTDNSIPLVAGKPTVIRIFPRIASGGVVIDEVTAKLYAYRDGRELAGSPIDPDNGPISVRNRIWRGDLNTSLNFSLEPAWYMQDTQFVAELILPSGVVGRDGNRCLMSKQYDAQFQQRRGLSIRYIVVNFAGNTPRARVGNQLAANYLRALYPVDPSRITYEPWSQPELPFDVKDEYGQLDGTALILELNRLFLSDPNSDRLYAWTPEGSFPGHGLSDPLFNPDGNGRVAFGNDTGDNSPSDGRWRRTFAHEIGHNTDDRGLRHPPRNPRSRYYYSPQLQNDEFGYDVLGTDSYRRVVMRYDRDGRDRLYDFMVPDKLEHEAWIGTHNYTKLFDHYEPSEADSLGSGNEDVRFLGGVLARNGEGAFTKPSALIPCNPKHQCVLDAKRMTSGRAQLRFYQDRGEREVEAMRISWTPRFSIVDGDDRPTTWFNWLVTDSEMISHRIDRVVLYWHDRLLDEVRFVKKTESFKISNVAYDAQQQQLRWEISEKLDQGPDRRVDVYVEDHGTLRLAASVREMANFKDADCDSYRIQLDLPSDLEDSACRFLIRIASSDSGGEYDHKDVVFEQVVDSCARFSARIVTPIDGSAYPVDEPIRLIGYPCGANGSTSGRHLQWRFTHEDTGDEYEAGKGNQVLLRRNFAPGHYKVGLYVEGRAGPEVRIQLFKKSTQGPDDHD